MAERLPDRPGTLDFYDEAQLREWAVGIGKSEGREGWPPGVIRDIKSMSKAELISFIARNHYRAIGY